MAIARNTVTDATTATKLKAQRQNPTSQTKPSPMVAWRAWNRTKGCVGSMSRKSAPDTHQAL